MGSIFCYIPWSITWKQVIAVATLVNGAIVTYISFQQYRTSVAQKQLEDSKHRSDLFDRRFAVFQAAQRVLSKVFREAACDYNDVHEFTSWTQQAYFLFNDEIYNYLLEIRAQLITLVSSISKSKESPDKADKQIAIKSKDEALTWLMDQLDTKGDGIFLRFKPYLRL